MPSPLIADLQIDAGWLLRVQPVEPLRAASVIVDEGRIVDVLPTAQAEHRYQPATRLDLSNHIVLPGLVNAHCHAAMTQLRGIADDLPLAEWLQSHIWPREAAHVSPEFVYDGSLLAAAEMVRGGITTSCDMYFFPDATAGALRSAGMRVQLGLPVLEFPSAYAPGPDAYLQRGLDVRDRLRDDPLVSFALAPHAPYTVSDQTFARIVTYADELGLPIQTHLHETAGEISDSIAAHGVRPLARLEALGVLGPGFIAIHAVHCDERDLATLARYACHVAHCPASNLKLGSGIAPVAKMLAAGNNVALGTDGAASNNRLDMFQEMRSAALVAKAVARDAQAMPAHAALRAATLGGAQALGLAERIGSIAPGKAADFAAIALRGPELAPCYDIVSHLVYTAGREHVTHVWVAGELRVRERTLQSEAFARLDTRLALWQNALGSLAGH
jgi:5-methylthioadenosine/S-adenosylhomocysteine deaminase